MGGGFAVSSNARVRIKGRTWSVVRFFFIAVAFMMAWVLISSLLGYYSKWFGPQVLLELSLAFNLPAIPVLIFAGQVEKLLDARLGPIPSMAVRLMFGLTGCTAVAAAFPFVPTTHASLLWVVAILGMVSAVAFSTAYQLVQWFRHADIIALGIGGVGTGPLVLILQLSLAVGPHPERWQWLAMFEATAAISFLGLLSAASLFAQYWKILTGEEEYIDLKKPLLPQADQDAEETQEQEQEERTMRLARATTEHSVLPPDPTAYVVSAILTGGTFRWPDEDDRGVPQLQRSATVGSCTDLAVKLNAAAQAAARDLSTGRRRHGAAAAGAGGGGSQRLLDRVSRTRSSGGCIQRSSMSTGNLQPLALDGSAHKGNRNNSSNSLQGKSVHQASSAATLQAQGNGSGSSSSIRPGGNNISNVKDFKGAWIPDHSQSLYVNHHRHASMQSIPSIVSEETASPMKADDTIGTPSSHQGTTVSLFSVFADQQEAPAQDADTPSQGTDVATNRQVTGVSGHDPQMTLYQEMLCVIMDAWQVLLAFLVSVTITYVVFPFFTYVESSGLIGDDLPKVLFFARIFADIVGRFAPRNKALMIKSSHMLVAMASFKTAMAVLFFVYIKSPQRFHHDTISLGLVLLIWLLGGYINTTANIMAPSLVAPALVGRASALLALIFQVAHFAGLVLAVLLAYLLYGTLVG